MNSSIVTMICNERGSYYNFVQKKIAGKRLLIFCSCFISQISYYLTKALKCGSCGAKSHTVLFYLYVFFLTLYFLSLCRWTSLIITSISNVDEFVGTFLFYFEYIVLKIGRTFKNILWCVFLSILNSVVVQSSAKFNLKCIKWGISLYDNFVWYNRQSTVPVQLAFY